MGNKGRHRLSRRHVAASAAGVAALFLVPLGWLVLSDEQDPWLARGGAGLLVFVPGEGTPESGPAPISLTPCEGTPAVGGGKPQRTKSASAGSSLVAQAKVAWKAERGRAQAASPVTLASAERVDLNALVRARGPQALEEHAKLLDDESRPEAVRATAARTLGTTQSPQALELLLRCASSPTVTTRRLAADGLRGRRDPFEAIGALERLLADADPVVRLRAVRALTAWPEGASTLARHLEAESRVEIQLACLDALGAVAGPIEERRLAAWSARPGVVGERATKALAVARERLEYR